MHTISQKISEIGFVPVIKLANPERDAKPLALALCAGGIPVAEVTFRAAGADTAIRLMKEACPDMLVGAGTVLNEEQIDRAIAAGAEIVAPDDYELMGPLSKNLPPSLEHPPIIRDVQARPGGAILREQSRGLQIKTMTHRSHVQSRDGRISLKTYKGRPASAPAEAHIW